VAEPIHVQHFHCAVCGAVNESTIYDDGTIDFNIEMHDVALHREVIAKAKAAHWN